MSSRLYPLYQKGNPQLRVFLPNFWMKLIKPFAANPSNRVIFHVSMGMSSDDVKNYLEKIYNVPVVHARTAIFQGNFKRVGLRQYVVKEDDYKVAFVSLPKNMKFEFPNLFPVEKKEEEDNSEEKNLEVYKTAMNTRKRINAMRSDVPSWFSA